MELRNITHCLWQSEFFSVLTEKEPSYIAKRGSIEKYAAGDTIYEQGQRERPLRRLMGCWCTLIGEEHVQMCTARCDQSSHLFSKACSDLREIMAKNSNMRIKILEKLVLILRERLISSYESMETL